MTSFSAPRFAPFELSLGIAYSSPSESPRYGDRLTWPPEVRDIQTEDRKLVQLGCGVSLEVRGEKGRPNAESVDCARDGRAVARRHLACICDRVAKR